MGEDPRDLVDHRKGNCWDPCYWREVAEMERIEAEREKNDGQEIADEV